MWARDLSGIRFTGERERNISGAFDLAVNDWAERTHTHTAEYWTAPLLSHALVQNVN